MASCVQLLNVRMQGPEHAAHYTQHRWTNHSRERAHCLGLSPASGFGQTSPIVCGCTRPTAARPSGFTSSTSVFQCTSFGNPVSPRHPGLMSGNRTVPTGFPGLSAKPDISFCFVVALGVRVVVFSTCHRATCPTKARFARRCEPSVSRLANYQPERRPSGSRWRRKDSTSPLLTRTSNSPHRLFHSPLYCYCVLVSRQMG